MESRHGLFKVGLFVWYECYDDTHAHSYADDTKLYLFYLNTLSQDHSLVVVEACISDFRDWLIHNRLLISNAKTEFLIIGSGDQLSKISIDSNAVVEYRKCSQSGLVVTYIHTYINFISSRILE